MTASEFAFLALGLALGVAGGSALVTVLINRPAAREVRVTVEHDAVPRRAATLSADAFAPSPAEVARGGPADRRWLDRDLISDEGPDPARIEALREPGPAVRKPSPDRTFVPSANSSPASVGVPIAPEHDPALDALRIHAIPDPRRPRHAGFPSATALLETRSAERAAAASPAVATAAAPGPAAAPASPAARASAAVPASAAAPAPADPLFLDSTAAIERILRGDYRALLACTVTLAVDDADRRPWHATLMALADAVRRRAIAEGWLDFPVGNPFWDTFTTAECRAIAGALAGAGFLFDGIDGWESGHIPGYTELGRAVSAAGLDQKGVRAWPTTDDISSLYTEVTVAGDDFLALRAPRLDLQAMTALVGHDLPESSRLWAAWDRVRRVLLAPVPHA